MYSINRICILFTIAMLSLLTPDTISDSRYIPDNNGMPLRPIAPTSFEELCEDVARQLLGQYPEGTYFASNFDDIDKVTMQLAEMTIMGLCVTEMSRQYSEWTGDKDGVICQYLPHVEFLCKQTKLGYISNALRLTNSTAIIYRPQIGTQILNREIYSRYMIDGSFPLFLVKYQNGNWGYDGEGSFPLESLCPYREQYEYMLERLGNQKLYEELYDDMAIVTVISLERNNSIFDTLVELARVE